MGVYWNKKDCSNILECFAFIDRSLVNGIYHYRIKDDYYDEPLKAKSIVIRSKDKDWRNILFQYFKEQYAELFSKNTNQKNAFELLIEEIKL